MYLSTNRRIINRQNSQEKQWCEFAFILHLQYNVRQNSTCVNNGLRKLERVTMDAEKLIPASWFYRNEDEKTMIHWFLYEYALKLYEHLDKSDLKTILGWKSRLSKEQLAEFCAYFSKRMRASIVDHLEGYTKGTAVYGEYLTDYCHANNEGEDIVIRKVAGTAWSELLNSCAACGCNCLGRRDEYCGFFDRMERGGYLS